MELSTDFARDGSRPPRLPRANLAPRHVRNHNGGDARPVNYHPRASESSATIRVLTRWDNRDYHAPTSL